MCKTVDLARTLCKTTNTETQLVPGPCAVSSCALGLPPASYQCRCDHTAITAMVPCLIRHPAGRGSLRRGEACARSLQVVHAWAPGASTAVALSDGAAATACQCVLTNSFKKHHISVPTLPCLHSANGMSHRHMACTNLIAMVNGSEQARPRVVWWVGKSSRARAEAVRG